MWSWTSWPWPRPKSTFFCSSTEEPRPKPFSGISSTEIQRIKSTTRSWKRPCKQVGWGFCWWIFNALFASNSLWVICPFVEGDLSVRGGRFVCSWREICPFFCNICQKSNENRLGHLNGAKFLPVINEQVRISAHESRHICSITICSLVISHFRIWIFSIVDLREGAWEAPSGVAPRHFTSPLPHRRHVQNQSRRLH